MLLRAAPLSPEPPMPDIFHDFPINVAPSRVFRAVSIPADLDQWWTERSSGEPRLGAEYQLVRTAIRLARDRRAIRARKDIRVRDNPIGR